MNLIILGSGTGIPSAHRGSPALVLISAPRPILFDMGPGTLRQLARVGIPHESIGRVFITHFHPDHTADLVHFLFATRNPPVLRNRRPFSLVGPGGFKAFLEGLEAAYGDWIRIPNHLMSAEEMEIGHEDQKTVDAFRVLTHPTPHTPNSLAYRVTSASGTSFVYTGDTGFTSELAEFARGCDCLITEASYPEGQEVEGHLTPSQAGRIAALAGARKLVLLHFYPEVLGTDIVAQCRKTFGGELVLGRDRLHLTQLPHSAEGNLVIPGS
jgi:ribonuclease BN (tRNA processing enzyme)